MAKLTKKQQQLADSTRKAFRGKTRAEEEAEKKRKKKDEDEDEDGFIMGGLKKIFKSGARNYHEQKAKEKKAAKKKK
jgi:hypothetical protein